MEDLFGRCDMKQTIAIIGCIDTKQSELEYMIQKIQQMNFDVFLIDASGTKHLLQNPKAEITNTMLLKEAGMSWDDMKNVPKDKILGTLTKGLKSVVLKAYKAGKFQGIISAGGMQNTLMAKTAMEALPFGFPKINVAPAMTVVEVDDALGRMDDVSTINSFADIGGGINQITKGILQNGLAALAGMMRYGSGEFSKMQTDVVGIMNLGVTAQGASKAAEILNKRGVETCMFHGTMHGAVVEKLIDQGVLKGMMMLVVHDILTEALGKYSFCKVPALIAARKKKIPLLVSLSGMDVIDMSDKDFCKENLPDIATRKYHYHNQYCVHVKTTEEEIIKGAKLLAERLNAYESPVTVLIPLKGFRTFTQKGEALYDSAVDGALIEYLHTHLKDSIRIIDVDANANDEKFSFVAADEMERLMKTEHGRE